MRSAAARGNEGRGNVAQCRGFWEEALTREGDAFLGGRRYGLGWAGRTWKRDYRGVRGVSEKRQVLISLGFGYEVKGKRADSKRNQNGLGMRNKGTDGSVPK